jgi:hypothetical protein
MAVGHNAQNSNQRGKELATCDLRKKKPSKHSLLVKPIQVIYE